jgi:hypothetical protein
MEAGHGPAPTTMPSEAHADAPPGQSQVRIQHHEHGVQLGEPDDIDDGDIHISIAQKMLSAVSGSVMTSLLGIILQVSYVIFLPNFTSHTPRRSASPLAIANEYNAVGPRAQNSSSVGTIFLS